MPAQEASHISPSRLFTIQRVDRKLSRRHTRDSQLRASSHPALIDHAGSRRTLPKESSRLTTPAITTESNWRDNPSHGRRLRCRRHGRATRRRIEHARHRNSVKAQRGHRQILRRQRRRLPRPFRRRRPSRRPGQPAPGRRLRHHVDQAKLRRDRRPLARDHADHARLRSHAAGTRPAPLLPFRR